MKNIILSITMLYTGMTCIAMDENSITQRLDAIGASFFYQQPSVLATLLENSAPLDENKIEMAASKAMDSKKPAAKTDFQRLIMFKTFYMLRKNDIIIALCKPE